MCLKVADDDVGRAHIDLELHEDRTRHTDDDDEPQATARRPLERRGRGGGLVAEVVAETDREAGREEPRRLLDRGLDPEIEVLGKASLVGTPKLVRVAALHDPGSRRGRVKQASEEPIDRDNEMDPTSRNPSPARLGSHPRETTRPSPSGGRVAVRAHRMAWRKSRCS